MAHDLRVDVRDARELAGPVGLIVRPGDPRGFVRLPLGGHAKLGMFGECAAAHLVDEPAGDGAVAVDAAVAQEGPVAADIFHLLASTSPTRISSLSCDASASTTPKGSQKNERAPEFEPCAFHFVAADVSGLVSNAIHDGDKNSVGDSVRALDSPPGIVLRRAVLFFFCRMPADGGGIKQHFRALQRSEARALGIPLVPADQRADASELRVKSLEARDRRE